MSAWSSDVCSSDLRGVPVPGAVRLAVLRGVPRWQPAVRPDQRRVPGCRLHARLLRLLDALVHGLGDHRLPGFRAARTPLGARNRAPADQTARSEEHTSELQSLMRIPNAVFCLKKKKT